jgi:Ca2+-dependent lipid-binding protein
MQVLAPSKIVKSWQMSVIIGNAEHLPKVATNGQIKPFVSARVNGMVLTSATKVNARPKFNAKL